MSLFDNLDELRAMQRAAYEESVNNRCWSCKASLQGHDELHQSGAMKNGRFTDEGLSQISDAMRDDGPTPGLECSACSMRFCMKCVALHEIKSCPSCKGTMVPMA